MKHRTYELRVGKSVLPRDIDNGDDQWEYLHSGLCTPGIIIKNGTWKSEDRFYYII
jgi:hypothetical protein